MLKILSGEDRVKEFLGVQERKSVQYRLMHYCVETNVEDGVLVFNQITRELVHLSHEEREARSRFQ